MARSYIAVASADHVRRGRSLGILPVPGGPGAPAQRFEKGDRLICYSPTKSVDGQDRLQAFTAIGKLVEGEPILVEMGPGDSRWHCHVDWWPAQDVPIRPLLHRLAFTRGRPDWGSALDAALIPVPDSDAALIAEEMLAEPL